MAGLTNPMISSTLDTTTTQNPYPPMGGLPAMGGTGNIAALIRTLMAAKQRQNFSPPNVLNSAPAAPDPYADNPFGNDSLGGYLQPATGIGTGIAHALDRTKMTPEQLKYLGNIGGYF